MRRHIRLNDADGDGVCDELEVLGCTDMDNPAYDPSATDDDGSCLVAGCLLPFACNYNSDADYIVVSLCDFSSCVDVPMKQPATTIQMPRWEARASVITQQFHSWTVMETASMMTMVTGCATNRNSWMYEPRCSQLQPIRYGRQWQLRCFGRRMCFRLLATMMQTQTTTCPDLVTSAALYGTGESDCNNEMACNYGAENEPCVFFDAEGNTCVPGGCMVEAACNYNVNAVYNDGSCEFTTCQVFGCNVEAACNHDAGVTVNDGSCDFTTCYSNDVVTGTNPLACNFDANAKLERWQL